MLFALRGHKEEVRKRLEKGREEIEVKVLFLQVPRVRLPVSLFSLST